MSRRPITRRQLLGGAGAVAAAVLAGCDAATPVAGALAGSGSTLARTWGDPAGDGQLRRLGGEPFTLRDDLAPAAVRLRCLGRLAHLTDAHVMDAASPARVPFLARLGPPLQSTFRPHETLTAQVLAGAVGAVRALRPHLVLQGGDLIDNDQANELELALGVLRGGRVRPGSGPDGYYGVQLASDPDPFYYRPAVDAPRHPGLLRAAVRPLTAPGLGRPWVPVLGDHDILVAGELVPSSLTRALAVGDRALWELPPDLRPPPGLLRSAAASPDGPLLVSGVDAFLAEALAGPTVHVPADPRRAELTAGDVVARLRSAAGRPSGGSPRLDDVIDVGGRLRLIVVDLASRIGGSGGRLAAGQLALVTRALEQAATAGRWVIFVSHQPLEQTVGGTAVQARLDASPRVLATVAGHTHRNRIRPRPTVHGGYWTIQTASLIDWPQQARALEVWETPEGVALRTWMLDHAAPGELGSLGRISRQLAYLDAQGGRPGEFAGTRRDRNVILYLRRSSPPS